MNDHDLPSLRAQIDTLNTQLVSLINQRAQVALTIGKAKQGKPIYDPVREAAVLKSVAAQNKGPLPNVAMQTIFREVIAACRNIQQPLRVAYLGPEGTYSEEAALFYTGRASKLAPYPSIDETIHAAEAGNVDIAIVPIENSTEGSVNRTLDLLAETPLCIVGELPLPIHHQLLSQAPTLDAITEVTAHPQALAQCQNWLTNHLPHATRTPAASNGAAAVTASKNKTIAAIAGRRASERYQLPILASNIEDTSGNTTRFIALGSIIPPATGNDKTSLICTTPNQPGALHHIIGFFAKNNINMIKLESRPAKTALWHYVFYIDIEGHQTDKAVARATAQLQKTASFVKLLGSYPKGESDAAPTK